MKVFLRRCFSDGVSTDYQCEVDVPGRVESALTSDLRYELVTEFRTKMIAKHRSLARGWVECLDTVKNGRVDKDRSQRDRHGEFVTPNIQ